METGAVEQRKWEEFTCAHVIYTLPCMWEGAGLQEVCDEWKNSRTWDNIGLRPVFAATLTWLVYFRWARPVFSTSRVLQPQTSSFCLQTWPQSLKPRDEVFKSPWMFQIILTEEVYNTRGGVYQVTAAGSQTNVSTDNMHVYGVLSN